MKYEITSNLFIYIEDENYGALGDDFSTLDNYTLQLNLETIENVLNSKVESNFIYGNICYKIHLIKEIASFYCYDEFLGIEPTQDVYEMFKQHLKLRLLNENEQ